jgi:hypothetical protein
VSWAIDHRFTLTSAIVTLRRSHWFWDMVIG